VEFFRNFPNVDCNILAFEVTKIIVLAFQKSGSYSLQGHICIKNVQNGGASLNPFFKASWSHA